MTEEPQELGPADSITEEPQELGPADSIQELGLTDSSQELGPAVSVDDPILQNIILNSEIKILQEKLRIINEEKVNELTAQALNINVIQVNVRTV